MPAGRPRDDAPRGATPDEGRSLRDIRELALTIDATEVVELIGSFRAEADRFYKQAEFLQRFLDWRQWLQERG